MGKAATWPWNNPDEWNHRRNEHIHGIARAVRIILDNEKDLLPEILKGWWKEVLFKATEIPEKYNTGYYSEGVLELRKISKLPPVEIKQKLLAHLRDTNDDKRQIQHDHVWSRDGLKKELSESGAEIEQILREKAWGCVLTKAEHQRLKNEPNDGDGGIWGKYHRAKVKVFDLLKGDWVKEQ